MTSSLLLSRAPQTDDELHLLVRAMWGINLPRLAVCPNHSAPFDAFAHAFFARDPGYAVWYGARGSGKSLQLGTLGLTKTIVHEVDTTILGGSMTQSTNVKTHMDQLLSRPNAPRHTIQWPTTQTQIQTVSGSKIRPLPASQTTVRGPHPPLSLLDEVDEMEEAIYEAATGQAMEQVNLRGELIGEYIVASSTWQNPDGTFSKVLANARKKGLPIFTWCWRELLQPHGWMSPAFVERKRKAVSAEMWRVEYDLGEPVGTSRAFDLGALERYFVPYPDPLRERHDGDDDMWCWEDPQFDGLYAVGADWAKERDKTVIAVVRYDRDIRKLVHLRRVNRRPYGDMIRMFDEVVQSYHAVAKHDGTGLGNVVNDVMTTDSASKVIMVGQVRTQLLTRYIRAFEDGLYRLPKLAEQYGNPLEVAHRATTSDDVYAAAKWDAHLPDDVAALALANLAIDREPIPAAGQAVPKEAFMREVDAPWHVLPGDDEMVVERREGDVTIVDERVEGGFSWFPVP